MQTPVRRVPATAAHRIEGPPQVNGLWEGTAGDPCRLDAMRDTIHTGEAA